mmetsp:Transcript_38779/g.82619  ORF Transcript_38779/g.82619 Transcript_38779/m.82619 type:complete len:251 (+) Transcript_38779:1378-2130(+)
MPSASLLGVGVIPSALLGVKPPRELTGVEPLRPGVSPTRPGVAPGVASATGLGVAWGAARGVMPPKSPRALTGSVFSPPKRGVLPARRAACTAASSSTVSAAVAERGVRIVCADGVCSYEDMSARVAPAPSSSKIAEALALTTPSSSRSVTWGGGSISLPLLRTAAGSFSLLIWSMAAGRLSSRLRLTFSASALRAFSSALSRLGASSFDLSLERKSPSSCPAAASAAASSPIVSKKPFGGIFWKGISVL